MLLLSSLGKQELKLSTFFWTAVNIDTWAMIFRNGCVKKLQESNTLIIPCLPQPEYRSLKSCLKHQTWDLCFGVITKWVLRWRRLSLLHPSRYNSHELRFRSSHSTTPHWDCCWLLSATIRIGTLSLKVLKLQFKDFGGLTTSAYSLVPQ